LEWEKFIYKDTRVSVKPNLTYPRYAPGVTTSPHFLSALLDVLLERTKKVTVCESDGGNRSYPAEEAFQGHGLYDICSSKGVGLVNLSRDRWEMVEIPMTLHGDRTTQIPLPNLLLHESDLLISVPVPKMHFVVRYTGAIKNHWGCVPDSMRLQYHHVFHMAILEIIKRVNSRLTVVDGEYFLDRNGPVAGDPVQMNLIIGADSPATADVLLTNLMGFPPESIRYIRDAQARGIAPQNLDEITLNTPLDPFKTRRFTLRRDPVDYLALLGFKSKLITRLVYLSSLRDFAHSLITLLRGGSRQVNAYVEEFGRKNSPG